MHFKHSRDIKFYFYWFILISCTTPACFNTFYLPTEVVEIPVSCAALRWRGPTGCPFAVCLTLLSVHSSSSLLSISCIGALCRLTMQMCDEILIYIAFNHDRDWCSLFYLCCHFLKVETDICHLLFFVPTIKLVLLTGHYYSHVALMFSFCPVSGCYICHRIIH